MATGSADGIAELRALLEACCDEIAALSDAEFLRSVEGEVPRDVAPPDVPAQGAPFASPAAIADGSAGPRWRPLLVGLPPGVEELVGIVEPPINAITALLQLLSTFLQILRALLIGIPDPFEALILAAIAALEAILNDLLEAGAHLYYDAPGLTSPEVALSELGLDFEPAKVFRAGERNEKRPPHAVDGFQRWAGRFAASFDDPGDPDRPLLSDGASVQAVFIVASAPSAAELAQLVWLLGNLLNIDAFKRALDRFVEDAHDPALSRVAQRSVAPDWHARKLRELIPPLDRLAQIPELLRGLLSKVQNVLDLLADLADAIQEKVEVLLELAEAIQEVIALLDALQSAGLYILPVATNEGVEGLERAFVEASNRPEGGFVAGACLLAGGPGLKDAALLWEIFTGGALEEAAKQTLDQVTTAGEAAGEAATDFARTAQDAWNEMVSAIESLPDDVVASLGRTREELIDAFENAPDELYAVLDDAVDVHVHDAIRRGRAEARELSRRGSRSLAMYADARPPRPRRDEADET